MKKFLKILVPVLSIFIFSSVYAWTLSKTYYSETKEYVITTGVISNTTGYYFTSQFHPFLKNMTCYIASAGGNAKTVLILGGDSSADYTIQTISVGSGSLYTSYNLNWQLLTSYFGLQCSSGCGVSNTVNITCNGN